MRLTTSIGAGLLYASLAFCWSATAATPVVVPGDFFTLEYDGDQLAGLQLFGDPKVGGNAVKFQPTGFLASVLGFGTASDSASAEIRLKLTANDGYAFSGVNYISGGDYTRDTFGAGTANVDASGLMTVADAGSPSSGSIDIPFLVSPDPLWPFGSNIGWNAGAWTDTAVLDPEPLTELSITLFQQLDADVADFGIQAKIQLKLARLLVEVEELEPNVVPLPPSALLFGTAVVAVAGFSRRARRA